MSPPASTESKNDTTVPVNLLTPVMFFTSTVTPVTSRSPTSLKEADATAKPVAHGDSSFSDSYSPRRSCRGGCLSLLGWQTMGKTKQRIRSEI